MSLMGHSFFKEAEEEYCPVFNVAFDSSHNLIITGGEDGLIKIWSRNNGALLSSLVGHTDYINKILVTQDNKNILSSGPDGVRLYEIETMTSMGGYDTKEIIDIGEIANEDGENQIIFANSQHLFLIHLKTMVEHRNQKVETHDFKLFNFSSHVKDCEAQNVNVMLINQERTVFMGFISGEIIIFSFDKLASAE